MYTRTRYGLLTQAIMVFSFSESYTKGWIVCTYKQNES